MFRTIPAERERGLILFHAPNRDGTALRVGFTWVSRTTNAVAAGLKSHCHLAFRFQRLMKHTEAEHGDFSLLRRAEREIHEFALKIDAIQKETNEQASN